MCENNVRHGWQWRKRERERARESYRESTLVLPGSEKPACGAAKARYVGLSPTARSLKLYTGLYTVHSSRCNYYCNHLTPRLCTFTSDLLLLRCRPIQCESLALPLLLKRFMGSMGSFPYLLRTYAPMIQLIHKHMDSQINSQIIKLKYQMEKESFHGL